MLLDALGLKFKLKKKKNSCLHNAWRTGRTWNTLCLTPDGCSFVTLDFKMIVKEKVAYVNKGLSNFCSEV